jgi:cytochrome b561
MVVVAVSVLAASDSSNIFGAGAVYRSGADTRVLFSYSGIHPMMNSRPDRYGSVAVTIHWLSAIAILALLATGLQLDNAPDPSSLLALLRIHVPLAITVLLLTIFRLVWWLFLDKRPQPVAGMPSWQERVARSVHTAFYVVLFGMLGSGIALIVVSGAGAVLFGGTGVLPEFSDFAPSMLHGLGALLLMILLVLHVGAALFHVLIRRDGIFKRMWYGGDSVADR